MILGFHYHIPALEKDGVIYTSGFLGVFLDSLSLQVDELVCFMHSPLPSENFMMDYALKSKNTRLITMGPHVSVPNRLMNANSIIKRIASELKKIDVLLIRCPTPLLKAISSFKPLRKAFLIVGDYQKSAQDIRQPFFKKKAIQLWVTLNKWQQDKAIKNALVFVNSSIIYDELKRSVKKLHLIRTTTLSLADFFSRKDTCQSKTINILYTGRLDLSKGLQEMIKSLHGIRLNGIDACLHLVGWEDKNATDVTSLIQRQAMELGLSDYVFFHGKKQIGDELNSFYRNADIYIIGSKANEGFPRTIWEAMANSLPVIASRLGSIPIFLEDQKHALLIEPGSIESMVSALTTIISDSNLRIKLIAEGFQLAKSNTLEVQVSKMIALLNEYNRD